MLTNAFRTLVKNPVKVNLYEKRKKTINDLTTKLFYKYQVLHGIFYWEKQYYLDLDIFYKKKKSKW